METELKINPQAKIVLFGPNGEGKSRIIRMLLRNAPAWTFVNEAVAQQHNVKIFDRDEIRFTDDDFAIVDPRTARRLYLEVYYNLAYDADLGWLPIKQLSYGQKRRLVVDAALEATPFTQYLVAIENFESGFHVDFLVELIKQIAEARCTVVLETHSILVLRLAERYGLHAYYVEKDGIKPIEKLDTNLFQRELSAYHAIVV